MVSDYGVPGLRTLSLCSLETRQPELTKLPNPSLMARALTLSPQIHKDGRASTRGGSFFMGVVVAPHAAWFYNFQVREIFLLGPGIPEAPERLCGPHLPLNSPHARLSSWGSRVTSVSWLKIKAGVWGSTGFWLAAAGAGSG